MTPIHHPLFSASSLIGEFEDLIKWWPNMWLHYELWPSIVSMEMSWTACSEMALSAECNQQDSIQQHLLAEKDLSHQKAL